MEQMKFYLVLGGLLTLTLIVASIAHRYHDYVEERRRQIERILRRVDELQALLQSLAGLPLAPEVIYLLRSDVLFRLQALKRIYSRHPGIDASIAKATAAKMEKPATPTAPAELDEAQFERLMRGLGKVEWMLREQRFSTPIGIDEQHRLTQSVAMQRAESLYRYHRRHAERLLQEGQLHQALWHCNQVRLFLREKGPDNEQTHEWYQELDRRYWDISAQIRGQA
jgi:hypothetical protein